MRRVVAFGIATVCLCSNLASIVAAAEPWRPGVARATRYAENRAGSVSFAVIAPGGRMYGYRRAADVPSASVIKAMFMVAYLRHPDVKQRAIRDSDRALLGPMIKRSDNDAATKVADFLGPRRINRLAVISDMRDFHYTRPWGLSTTSARDQARFFFKLERYVPGRHEGYARYLLSHIVESQRWGIVRVHRPNWKFFFKGGWGSGTGSVNHQAAFLERGPLRIAIAIMTRDNPSHDYGSETLRAVAARLLHDLPEP